MFLERHRYRLRRLSDAAYLLPILGFLMWSLPAIRNPQAADTRSTSDGAIYLFLVWAGLILAAFLLSRALRRAEASAESETVQKSEGSNN